jgi:hypothetical protein
VWLIKLGFLCIVSAYYLHLSFVAISKLLQFLRNFHLGHKIMLVLFNNRSRYQLYLEEDVIVLKERIKRYIKIISE